MHLFIAFVVIVVLIGLGFGRIMAKVLLVTVGIPALVVLLIATAPGRRPGETPSAPAQVSSSDCLMPAQLAAVQAADAKSQDPLDLGDPVPCGTDGEPCALDDQTDRCKSQPAQAERSSDPYQKSLQTLAGENLAPLN